MGLIILLMLALSTNPPKLHCPSEFEWTHKIFRCTHGVTQGSRSKGHRKSRHRACKARLTAVVAPVARNTHAILIRNENHTHSHPNIGTQASAYLTTKTLPLDEQDRECKIPYFLAVRMRMSKALLHDFICLVRKGCTCSFTHLEVKMPLG
ncbi:hypothetical protein GQ600_12706 [Phytophthora cactorum]|nr:hypothetical protein GQ600_1326 [Phytophthora cactorum]KAF1785166.1 hypothetical protein GQ600_12706 [Phytophthora cactorum]